MKPLILTEEQKNKLLEMCKALFPEWKAHSLITGEQYVSDDSGEFSESDETFKIHWFEFCIMHLAAILYNKLDSSDREFTILYYGGMISQEAEHPVDYLYEEFKKLK